MILQKNVVYCTLKMYNYVRMSLLLRFVWVKEMQRIGERLTELRKKNNLYQADIARILNVSQQVISNIERGVTTPDLDQLKKLADLYKLSLDQLVGRDFEKNDQDDYESRVLSYINRMDDEGKELSLGLLSQIVQHQGGNDGDK